MIRDDVFAAVVSYNGGPTLMSTVVALRDQVGQVCVVDNGSGPQTSSILDELSTHPRTTVVRLGANRGIGHALNVAVERARQEGYAWLLTMDQDSLVDPGLMEAYRTAIAGEPGLVSLTPVITGQDGVVHKSQGGSAPYAITSGNLVAVRVFEEIGLYDAGLFIDCVDFDFSLRLRRAGHAIVRVQGARMFHRLGVPTAPPRLWRKYYTLHPPLRRYYMTRNFLYLAERHFARFPRFIAKLGAAQLLLTVLAAFLDPAPLESCRAMARGVGDYLRRRVGPAPGVGR